MSRRIFVPQSGKQLVVPKPIHLPPITTDPHVVDELAKRHPIDGIKSSARYAGKSSSARNHQGRFVSFGPRLHLQRKSQSNQKEHDEFASPTKRSKTRKRPSPIEPMRLAFDVVLRELGSLDLHGNVSFVQRQDICLRELPPSPVNPYKLLLHFKSEPGQERPLMPSLARHFVEENFDNRLGYEEPIRDRNKDWREDLWTKIIPVINAMGVEPIGDRLIHNMSQIEQGEHVMRGIVLKEHVILRKAHRIGTRQAIVTVFGVGIAGRAYVQASRYPRYINVRVYLPSKRQEYQLMLDSEKLVSLFEEEAHNKPLRAGKKRALCETIVRMLAFDVEMLANQEDDDIHSETTSRPVSRDTDRPDTAATLRTIQSKKTKTPGTPATVRTIRGNPSPAKERRKNGEKLTLTISAGVKANATDERIARLLLNAQRSGRRPSQASIASYLQEEDKGSKRPEIAVRKQGLLVARSAEIATHLVVVSVYNPPKRQSTFLVCVYDPHHCNTYQMSVGTREVAIITNEPRLPLTWSIRRKVMVAKKLISRVELLNFSQKTAIQIGTRVGLAGPAICREGQVETDKRRQALIVMPGKSTVAQELRDLLEKSLAGSFKDKRSSGRKSNFGQQRKSRAYSNRSRHSILSFQDGCKGAMNLKMPRRLIGKGPSSRPLVHGAERILMASSKGSGVDSSTSTGGVLCIFELHDAFRGVEWACLRIYLPATSTSCLVLVTFEDMEAYTKVFCGEENMLEVGEENTGSSDAKSVSGDLAASDSSADSDDSSSSSSTSGSSDDEGEEPRTVDMEDKTNKRCRALVRNCIRLSSEKQPQKAATKNEEEDMIEKARSELCGRVPDLINRCIYRNDHPIPQLSAIHTCTVALYQEEGGMQLTAQIQSSGMVLALALETALAKEMVIENVKLSAQERDVHVSVMIEELSIVETGGVLTLVYGALHDEDDSDSDSDNDSSDEDETRRRTLLRDMEASSSSSSSDDDDGDDDDSQDESDDASDDDGGDTSRS